MPREIFKCLEIGDDTYLADGIVEYDRFIIEGQWYPGKPRLFVTFIQHNLGKDTFFTVELKREFTEEELEAAKIRKP